MPSYFQRGQNPIGDGWPKKYSCKFIEGGLVAYDDHGTVLVRQETLDKMAPGFVGKPVINEIHMDIEPSDFEEVADGNVTDVDYGRCANLKCQHKQINHQGSICLKCDCTNYVADGWWWADFIVWDEATKKNCESGAYSVSCAYDVTDFKSEAGEHNNVPYQKEVLDGKYSHLAIVANPRYEDARIVVYNSKGGSKMIVKLWKKLTGKDGKENKIVIENAGDRTIDVDGTPRKLSELVDEYKRDKASVSIENEKINEASIIEIDGEEMTVKDFLQMRTALKNKDADDDEDAKKKKEMEEAKNAEDKEKDEKEKKDKAENEDKDKEKKDAEEKEKAENAMRDEHKNAKDGKHFNNEMENCAMCNEGKEGIKAFNGLKNAHEMRGKPQDIKVTSLKDRQAVGRERYG